MSSVWNFIRNNKVLLALLIAAACVVPIMTVAMFGSVVDVMVLMNCYWLGFYGCILLCLTKCPLPMKIILAVVNLLCFLGVMFVFLMGGTEVIPAMLLKMALPFAPNPGLNSGTETAHFH